MSLVSLTTLTIKVDLLVKLPVVTRLTNSHRYQRNRNLLKSSTIIFVMIRSLDCDSTAFPLTVARTWWLSKFLGDITSQHITWLQRSPLSRSSSHSHLSPPPQGSPATASCSCRGPRPLLALQNCQLPNQRHRWTRFHCRHSIVNIIIVIIFTGMSVCLCHCRYDHCFCYPHHRQERGTTT